MDKGTMNVPVHGPKAGAPAEAGEFPHVLMVEGDRCYDGLSRV